MRVASVRIGGATLVVVAAASLAPAEASPAPEAIEVDRDMPPPGRVELGFDGGAPVDAWGVGIQLGYVDQPIAIADVSAGVTKYPVDHRETLAIGGAYALGDRLVVDIRLPFDHQIGTRLQGLGDPRPLARFVIGDLALGARVRLSASERVQTFLRAALTLPTGDDEDYAGDASWSYATSLIARVTLAHGVVIAATGGIHVRREEVQVADRTVGDEAIGGIGATIELPPVAGLWCEASQVRALAELVAVLGDDIDHQIGPSPAEARVGVIGRPTRELTIGARAGVGLDDQIGAPRVRAMVELAWQPAGVPRPIVQPAPIETPADDVPDDDDD
jgi:hypothetical protein